MAVSMRPSEHVSGDLAVDGIPVEGFEELYEAYAPRVRGLIRRLIADHDLGADVLQETFLRAFRASLHTETGEDQWPWLATVARNLCFDALRKRSFVAERDQIDERVLMLHVPETDGDPEWHFTRAGRREGIAEALESVSPRCRRILLRKHLDGWAYDEIAASEGMSVDAVKSALARARRTFRESYAAIAEHRGLGAALAGFLVRMRARVHSARHRLAERMSASAPYFPQTVAFGDALAAAVVAGAVAISAGLSGGAPPERAVVKDAVLGSAAPSVQEADVDELPSPGQDVRRSAPSASEPATPGASKTATPAPSPAPSAQPSVPAVPPVDLPPPDPNQRHSFDSDEHVPAEDPPAGGELDLGIIHDDDGQTGISDNADVDLEDEEENLTHGYAGVDCAQEQRDASITINAACTGLDQL